MTELVFRVDEYATADGQTDDAPAIQRLLSTNPADGSLKLVFGHKKTYYLSKPLYVLYSHTFLDGHMTVLNLECENEVFKDGIIMNGVSNCSIRGFIVVPTGSKPPSALKICYLEWKLWLSHQYTQWKYWFSDLAVFIKNAPNPRLTSDWDAPND